MGRTSLTAPGAILDTTCPPKIAASVSGTVLRPKCDEHWELRKGIIEELYLVHNLPVIDVIGIMKKSHNFIASPKMYRNQFTKWNWRKYRPKSTSNRFRGDESRSPGQKSCLRSAAERARAKSSLGSDCASSSTTPTTRSSSPHTPCLTWSLVDDEMSQHKYRTARDMPLFLGNCSSESNAASIEQCRWVISGFYHGLGKLLSGFYEVGKVYLDWAFSQIWKVLKCPNWEALLKFCLLEPFSLAVLSLRRASPASCPGEQPNCHRIIDDILREYLHHLSGLTRARLGDHPMASTLAGMRYAFGKTPQHQLHFVLFLQEQVIGEMVKVGRIRPSGDLIVLLESSIVRGAVRY